MLHPRLAGISAVLAMSARVLAVEVADVDRSVLGRARGVSFYQGGFGSALSVHPTRAGHFFLLTDRGPNVGTGREDEKVFLRPGYAPRIGLFAREGGRLRLVRSVVLRDERGRPLVGLPNPPGRGGTGEAAFDLQGRTLRADARGVDPEGLAALPDGTFWVAEEYGPSLLHVDARGRTIERVSPHLPGRHGLPLPRVLAARRPNYGFEGLAATGRGTLVALLQGPLDNPGPAVRTSARLTRLVVFYPATGRTQQFAYLHDGPGYSNTALAALAEDEFLVVERDGAFAGHPTKPARHKRVYRVRLAGATDLSDPEDGPRGRLHEGKTPEELTDAERARAGLRPVERTLLVDLLALPGGYPHDKPEGLAVLGERTLALVNDDDFGITDEGGRLVPKTLPAAGGARDRNRVHFIELLAPLR